MVFQVALWLSLLLSPAAPAAEKALPAAEIGPPAPDTSRIIALVGKGGNAHACPVGPEVALTAGHVVPEGPFRGESAEWSGFLDSEFASEYEDAGFLRATTPFPSWYSFAYAPPAIGERVWWVGYDWRTSAQAFKRRVFSGLVVSLTAGSIVIDATSYVGSSGSCVLNSDGRIVGEIAWGRALDDSTDVTVAVGMWPPWFTDPKKVRP